MKIVRTAKGKYQYGHWKWMMDIYEERIREVLPALARSMRFKLPPYIRLRPLYVKNGKSYMNGWARWSNWEGYSIVMCVESCNQMEDYGIWVAEHEAAHIACIIKHSDWTHGRTFTETFVKAMAVPKKNVYVNKAVPKERKK